jgi:membrane-bound lytic murein transglycosylase B
MPMRTAATLLVTLLLACSNPGALAAPHARGKPGDAKTVTVYGKRADVIQFASEVAERRGLPRAWLLAQLAQARRVQAVRKLIMPPAVGTTKNWAAYRARFIEPRRIEAGVDFWHANEGWLRLAEQRWGVPPEIVVAIVGVETFFGRVTGTFRTLDALATLSFDFPTGRKDRSAFFRSELEEFFVLCAREGADPQTIKGSYAGALGLPQFMPGSINRFAVDLDGDGRIDLQTSAADVVGSVAHYLAQSGWQRGLPTHFAVALPVETSDRAALLGPDILPSFTAAQFAEHGAVLEEAGRAHDGLLALVELQNGTSAPSYVVGTRNFYAITRYNWSSYYGMAVIELAEAVRQQWRQ